MMENLVPLLILLAALTGLVLLVIQQWSLFVWATIFVVTFLASIAVGNSSRWLIWTSPNSGLGPTVSELDSGSGWLGELTAR